MKPKKIAIILPVNNPDMLTQADLLPYQTAECHFELSYAETNLKELNTREDAEEVLTSVLQKMLAAEKSGAAAIIVYAFGDLGIKEGRELVSIPVMGLGKSAVHMASLLCRKRYTIIPGQMIHNLFLEALVKEEKLEHNFVLASHSINMFPSEMKNNPATLGRLIEAASKEIIEKDVDTFTLGCGCFIGVAKPLETELKKRFKKSILVIDPVALPLEIAMNL